MDKYAALVSAGKEAYLKVLEEIGWFNYPQNDRAQIEEKIARTNGNDFYLALTHFNFYEDDVDIEDFKHVLDNVLKITGLKTISADLEQEGEESIKINVVTEKVGSDFDFDISTGYIDTSEVEDYFNDLLWQNDINDRLLWLPLESALLFYVVVPLELYVKAMKIGILPYNEDYLEILLDQWVLDDEE